MGSLLASRVTLGFAITVGAVAACGTPVSWEDARPVKVAGADASVDDPGDTDPGDIGSDDAGTTKPPSSSADGQAPAPGVDAGKDAAPPTGGKDAGPVVPPPPTPDAGPPPVVDAGPPPATGVFANAPPYTQRSGGSGRHNAGRDCFQCHGNGAPNFVIAGTIYNANGGAVSGVEIRSVDANGQAYSVYSGTNGNFYKLGTPLSSTVHVGARNANGSEDMMSAVTDGSCNSCHCGNGCATTRLAAP